MTDVSKFFTALSERAYKENDLSDVTYAMCEADPVFKQFFLDFFFRDQELNAEDCTIYREVAYQDGARPDIVIRSKTKGVYFVEVKIGDGNHHFAQYASTLKNLENILQETICDHFGYIANYDVSVSGDDECVCAKMREKERVRKWEDLCAELEKYSCFDDLGVMAYLVYCRKVLGGDDLYKRLYTEYEMPNLTIVGILDALAKVREYDVQLLSAIEDDKEVSIYNQAKYFNPTFRMGHHFSFSSIEGKNDDVWAWIGIELRPWDSVKGNGCRPCIILRDCKGWGMIVCDKIRAAGQEVYEEDGKVFLGLKREAILNPSETLKSFVSWVRNPTSQGLGTILGDESVSLDCAKVFYIVPMFIRNELTGSVRTDKCEYKVEFVYGNDAQQPQSWCGEYLEITRVFGRTESSLPDGENRISANESKKRCYVGFSFANEKESGLFLEVDGKRIKIAVDTLAGLEDWFKKNIESIWDGSVMEVVK